MNNSIEIKDKSEADKLIKVAPFRTGIRKTQPHKHNNYFEIIYLSQGKGIHYIDQNEFQIQSPVIFFIRKEQVHYWNITSAPKGYVVIIKKDFVDQCYDKDLKGQLSKLSALTHLQLKDHTTIEQLFELLEGESNVLATEGLLKALFAKIMESTKSLNTQIRITENLFQSYKDLLSKTDELKNSVVHYATLLNTTPQNLNAVCRKNMNQSATQILSETIIGEAKRLLIYTDNTVSEISFLLSFNDSSHFVKYFKRHTGKTPQSFRNS